MSQAENDRRRLTAARFMTVGSFVINFGCQVYGMVSKPNMKEVADAYHYAFSPNPWFIAGFFSFQVVLQLAWISNLFRPRDGKAYDVTAYGEPSQIRYSPIYALGNLCIAGWMLFWNSENFVASQILVTINTFAQLYACFFLLPYMTRDNIWTHLVAQTFAGIGILDLIDNGGVALRITGPPSKILQALTGTIFGLGTLFTNPIFSVSLVYDLVALSVGQSGHWARTLAWMAMATGIVAGIKLVLIRIPNPVAL